MSFRKGVQAVGMRIRAMQIISGSEHPLCENCGCNYVPFLEINHKNGSGTQDYGLPGRAEQAHARKYGKGGSLGFYTKIVSGGRPTDDLNILCRVCNALDYLRRKSPEEGERFSVIWGPLFVDVSKLRRPLLGGGGGMV